VDNSDIVIRDQNGDFQIDDVPLEEYDELEEGGGEEREDESMFYLSILVGMRGGVGSEGYLLMDFIEEKQRLSEAVKHHQRDRNRAPSEPAGML